MKKDKDIAMEIDKDNNVHYVCGIYKNMGLDVDILVFSLEIKQFLENIYKIDNIDDINIANNKYIDVCCDIEKRLTKLNELFCTNQNIKDKIYYIENFFEYYLDCIAISCLSFKSNKNLNFLLDLGAEVLLSDDCFVKGKNYLTSKLISSLHFLVNKPSCLTQKPNYVAEYINSSKLYIQHMELYEKNLDKNKFKVKSRL